jgi:hypothetical protein
MNRILIVTIGLVGRSGTEIVTLETARGLRGRGHEVAIFTPEIGPLGRALMREGFVVVDDAGALPWTPTIIQANQTFPLIDAVARFPGVPVVSICHDATIWYNEPIELPSIGKYAAVSLACRDRIARQLPHLPDDIELLHNAVDLDAYRVRGALPAKPRRALILSHRSNHLAAVRAACAALGLAVDALGAGAGEVVSDLPARLVQYDLVFAIGRMALEAMAVGCAVVAVDGHGLAGLVTSGKASAWRDHNFGSVLLTRPVSVDALRADIRRYDAADAARVSKFVREHCSLESYLDRLEAIHRELMAGDAALPPDHGASSLALSKASRQLALASRRQLRAEKALRRMTRLRNLLPNLAKRIVRPWMR